MGRSGMEQVVTDRKDCTRQAGRQRKQHFQRPRGERVDGTFQKVRAVQCAVAVEFSQSYGET